MRKCASWNQGNIITLPRADTEDFLKTVALKLNLKEEEKCTKGRALGNRLAKLLPLRVSQPKCQLYKDKLL